MIKVAIFDLDGTVADTLVSIATAMNETLKEFGLEEQPVQEYCYFAGDGADTLVKRALIAAGDREAKKFEEAYAAYRKFFEKDCTYGVSVFDGLKETLDQMKEQGIKIAILTNKPHERAIDVVNYLFEPNYFDCVLGQTERMAKKPDPVGALYLAKQFGVKPEECLYVGDTNVDMQTGKSAGMYTVGVLWGFREKEELERFGADRIIEKPQELLTCFQ